MKNTNKKININLNRRNFLTGSASIAGLAATASVVPLNIVNANHSEGSKGLPEFINWKDRDALIIHSDKGIETHRSAIGESLITPNRNVYIRNNMPTMTDKQIKNFIMFYERLTKHMIKNSTRNVDTVIKIDEKHRLKSIRFK